MRLSQIYDDYCRVNGTIVEGRKNWFAVYAMNKFLRTVPAKLQEKVDVGLACAVAVAYIKLELSNAVSDAIT